MADSWYCIYTPTPLYSNGMMSIKIVHSFANLKDITILIGTLLNVHRNKPTHLVKYQPT